MVRRVSAACSAVVAVAAVLAGALTTVAGPTTLAAGAVAPSAPGTGYVVLDGDGLGSRRREWTAADVVVEPLEYFGQHGFRVTMPSDEPTAPWRIDVLAPEGEELTVGRAYEAQRPPSEFAAGLYIGGEGTGCSSEFERFRIVDLAPDLSRVWVVLEAQCGPSPLSSFVWGEIRLGVGADAPTSTVLSDVRQLPEQEIGTATRFPLQVRYFSSAASTTTVAPSVATGGTDFSIVSTDCGRVDPHSSCEARVSFRPTASGVRRGSVVFATPSGAHTVRLEALGAPGASGYVTRGEPGEPLTGGADRRAVGDGTVDPHTWYERPRYDDLVIDLGDMGLGLAGVELPLETGDVYVDDGGDGPDLSLSHDGLVCDGQGSLTFDHVLYRTWSEVAFTGRFEHYCGGWVTGSFSYRTDGPPPAPDFPAARPAVEGRPPTLTLTVNPVPTRGPTELDVEATTSHRGAERLSLEAISPDGSVRHLGSSLYDAYRVIRLPWDTPRTTTFVVRLGRHERSLRVPVPPRLQLSGPRRVAPPPGRPRRSRVGFLVRTAPVPLSGACLRLQVQDRGAGRWRGRASRCLPLDAEGTASPTVGGPRGRPARVRLVWPGSTSNAPASTAWTRVKFPGRRA